MNLMTFKFDDVFAHASIRFINNLKEFNLIEDDGIDLRKRDVKRILYHTVLTDLMTVLQQFSIEKRVVIVQPSMFADDLEVCQYCDITTLKKLVTKCLMFMKKPYYDKIVFLNKELKDYNEDIDIILMSSCNVCKDVSYAKLATFSKNNELREVYAKLKNQAL